MTTVYNMHVYVFLLCFPWSVFGIYYPDSTVLTRDGVTISPETTIASVYFHFADGLVHYSTDGQQVEYSCSFPCSVARTVSLFCRSHNIYGSSEVAVAECIRNTWKAHALGEHLLGLRESIKELNIERGIQRSNNW